LPRGPSRLALLDLVMSRTTESPAATLRLRDGRRVTVREAGPCDEREIGKFLAGLSVEARRLRFFTGAVDLAKTTHDLARTGPGRIGLLALDAQGTVVGHAVAFELSPGRAEVAVEVADSLQGDGLGTILIERLSEVAEQRGILTFVAEVLPENRAMLDVLRDGFGAHLRWSDGVDTVEFPTRSWRLARDRYSAMFDCRAPAAHSTRSRV